MPTYPGPATFRAAIDARLRTFARQVAVPVQVIRDGTGTAPPRACCQQPPPAARHRPDQVFDIIGMRIRGRRLLLPHAATPRA